MELIVGVFLPPHLHSWDSFFLLLPVHDILRPTADTLDLEAGYTASWPYISGLGATATEK
jgi:hypothetical protein